MDEVEHDINNHYTLDLLQKFDWLRAVNRYIMTCEIDIIG